MADGIDRVKVDPRPSSLLTVKPPPSSLANSRLMARPSPKPMPGLVKPAVGATRWNLSKMKSNFSGAMPIPVSATDTSKRSLMSRAERRMPPATVFSTALPARFMTMRDRSRGSL